MIDAGVDGVLEIYPALNQNVADDFDNSVMEIVDIQNHNVAESAETSVHNSGVNNTAMEVAAVDKYAAPLDDAVLELEIMRIINRLGITNQELIQLLSQHSITAEKMDCFTFLEKDSLSLSMSIARVILRRGIWYNAGTNKYVTKRAQKKKYEEKE